MQPDGHALMVLGTGKELYCNRAIAAMARLERFAPCQSSECLVTASVTSFPGRLADPQSVMHSALA